MAVSSIKITRQAITKTLLNHVPGISGLNKILKGAKFVYSDGLASVFTKTGGYSQAAKDFKKVKPTKVKGKQPKSGMVRKVSRD